MAEQKLLGKRAIVTGGATGIGYGIALRFIAEGATVIITDIDQPGGIAAAEKLGPNCDFVHHDVSVPADWDAVFSIAKEKFSGLDIMVNVAGVTLMGTIEELDVETWDKTMGINVRSCFLGCQGAIKLMKTDGGGSIRLYGFTALKPYWYSTITTLLTDPECTFPDLFSFNSL